MAKIAPALPCPLFAPVPPEALLAVNALSITIKLAPLLTKTAPPKPAPPPPVPVLRLLPLPPLLPEPPNASLEPPEPPLPCSSAL